MFLSNEKTINVLEASDEQFESFRLLVGIPVNEGEEGKKWSFENRCRAINHALKYGLPLPFVETDSEQISNKNNSEESAQTSSTG